jgi:hypothetical protein
MITNNISARLHEFNRVATKIEHGDRHKLIERGRSSTGPAHQDDMSPCTTGHHIYLFIERKSNKQTRHPHFRRIVSHV